ncbi:MAG: hypothetical protein U0167_08250 [bacterium]
MVLPARHMRYRAEMPSVVWIVAGAILLVNVPFGFWRAGVRKFSVPWFVAVHAPVPLAIGLRFAAGLGFRLATLPIFIAAYFAGQMVGGRLRRRPAAALPALTESAPDAAGDV